MNWTEPETIIAIYAGVLSTIVFLWQIYDKYIESKGNIHIKIAKKSQWLVYQDKSLGSEREVLEVEIINKGRQDRHIERPGLEFNKVTSKGKIITPLDITDMTKYPLLLIPGEKKELYFDLNSLTNNIRNADIGKAKKIRGYTKDTFGKKYNSDWLKITDLIN